jgi:hypothetical protein
MEPRPYPDDEISLIDLWNILVRRKAVFAATFGFFFIATVGFVLLKSEKYLFSTTLEIGSTTEGGERILIDKPETILAKIQEGYIPAVLNGAADSNDGADKFKLTVRVPKGSDVVVIESKAKESDGEKIKTLEERIIAMVQKDHERILEVVRTNIAGELEMEQRRLDELKDAQKVIQGDMERTNILSGLLDQQLTDIKSLVDDAVKNRKRARKSVGDATHAMTLLIIDNEIDQNRARMAELQERRYVMVPDEQAKLEKALADNVRGQDNVQLMIDQVKIKLKNIRETRAVLSPTRSLEPVGLTKPLMLILGILLGGIMSLFAAFFADFLAKAREQMAEG